MPLKQTERGGKIMNYTSSMAFPGGSEVKNRPANAGDADLIPGSGRPPGGGKSNSP